MPPTTTRTATTSAPRAVPPRPAGPVGDAAAAAAGRPVAAPDDDGGAVLAQLYLVTVPTDPDAPDGAERAVTELARTLRLRALEAPGFLPAQPDAVAPRPLPAVPGAATGRATYPVAFSLWRSPADLLRHVHHTGPELRRWAAATGCHPRPERVLWWVPAGHVPDLAEALERRARLLAHGPGPDAFTLRSPTPPSAVTRCR